MTKFSAVEISDTEEDEVNVASLYCIELIKKCVNPDASPYNGSRQMANSLMKPAPGEKRPM